MASLAISFRHGQTPEVARTHFETAIERAASRYGEYIKQVEWMPDRTAVRLSGKGFNVLVRLDDEAVHASGDVPFFARMMLDAPIRKFLEETFGKPGPKSPA